MTQHQTSRTLVKSTPELWAECSDAASLARHLGAFGEIRITKLEPETAVAWEGTAARGTVKLEPSGWGTRVTLTLTEERMAPDPPAGDEPAAAAAKEPAAIAVAEEPADAPEEEPAAIAVAEEPTAAAEGEPAPVEVAPPAEVAPARPGLFARLMTHFRGGRPEVTELPAEAGEALVEEPVAAQSPEPAEPEPATPEPPAADEPAELTAGGARQGEAALAAALDSLGRAHHRPYSRA
jgi:hypothetical protein